MFEGPTGKKFRVHCPNNCAHSRAMVFGTMIYYEKSSVCQAAVHSGIMSADGGDVILEIANGQAHYQGSK